ncbi:MAG: hypothetical protein J6K41_10380 [Paraprevotella sp.]|jgi:hypothetical protein|nr:hypothetical protein [Paraprevotella sp.]
MENKGIKGEVLAAITMALHEHFGFTAHDSESGRLTLEPEGSEWNSKLRVQRELPNRKF